MAIPTLITELSTTAAANSPAGSDSPSTLDDIQRAHAAFIAQLRDADALKLDAAAVSAFGLTLIDDAGAAAARTTLGAAASGANTDITSLGAVTGVTAPLADNTTKLATTAFVIANAPVIADATEAAAGKIELATASEAIAGTDAVRAITPAGLRSGLNASGTAPVYACRAWVNFNGSGTVSIRASGNVSSITDNGVGDYTVNFSSALPDANYAALVTVRNSAGPLINVGTIELSNGPSTTNCRIESRRIDTRALEDSTQINFAIFR